MGCWLWTASTVGGRGYIRCDIRDDNGLVVKVRSVYAHRFSWEIHVGPIPTGLMVCHTCDNPLCVCPDHLFLGSQAENMTDRNTKKRQARGEWHGRAKVTAQAVRRIRTLRAAGATQVSLAEQFGLSRRAVRSILDGRNWRHV
jgi:hypothetical protein